jgi:tetratricopeptide (TPR) repeat protein
VRQYQKVSELEPPGYDLLANWALAYDCLGQPEPAIQKLREAAALEPTAHAYSSIGMILAKQARWPEALSALNTAEQRDPSYAMTYVYRGNIYLATNQPSAAAPQFQRALNIEPGNQLARDGLAVSTAGMRNPPAIP